MDCSNKNLKQIPKGIPYNTVQLNLSHNLLKTLDVNDLIECKELQQVYLSDNQIESIANYEVSICVFVCGLELIKVTKDHIKYAYRDFQDYQALLISTCHQMI